MLDLVGLQHSADELRGIPGVPGSGDAPGFFDAVIGGVANDNVVALTRLAA